MLGNLSTLWRAKAVGSGRILNGICRFAWWWWWWWWWWRVDASRSSPSLASIPAKVVRSADPRSQQRHIVVVAEGQTSRPVVDSDLQRLSQVQSFTPLLRSTVSLSDDVTSRPPMIDSRHVLALCSRYHDHLHQCAEAVAFDQNALCVRIKEVTVVVML